MKISVFINTLNESRRIRNCLRSLTWADEIVVVDMHSDDDTVSICREFNAKVFLFDRVGYCEPARKFAMEQVTGDWVLNIDADEMVTVGLKEEIMRLIKTNACDAAYVPRKNLFWGEEMRFSGCGLMQDRPLRLYKRHAVVFSDTIHAGIQMAAGMRVMNIDNSKAHLLHFSYLTPDQYWDKLQRYTTIEAKALFEQQKVFTSKQAFKIVWNAFWKRYIKKGKGYKDGQWGLIYCLWTAVYQLNVYAKYVLMKKYNTVDYGQSIEKAYAQMAQETLDSMAKGEST